MDVNRLDSRFGAEVAGLDLSQPLDPVIKSKLNTVFVDNVVLCFRGQSFDRPEMFIRAVANLGRPMAPVTATFRLPGFDVIEELTNHATDKRTGGNERLMRGGSWHTDHSTLEAPPKATVLYAIDVPVAGGNTEFTNLFLAYDSGPTPGGGIAPRGQRRQLSSASPRHPRLTRRSRSGTLMTGTPSPS